ncbi:hypothetical protein KP79_PYT12780 [Mizuhopecten yessoensis]|uniref:Uncharacterized protein n=1 Tax=Mizuhopecten yessoensis TaxID=6573 RepID=A0A210QD11_MIZYE|nr:hypothetical protein KP79_PYT12780 [Mizuhopecten yessoensis]
MVLQTNALGDKSMNGVNLTAHETLLAINGSAEFRNYSTSPFENVTILSHVLNVSSQPRVVVTPRPPGTNEAVYQGAENDGLPVPILIASPVAAVSIVIFVCLAYYWHAAQLDARARELAIKVASGELDMEIPIKKSITASSILSNTDSDILLYQQHNKRRGTIRASATLTPPPMGGARSSRGSVNWSAIADKELVTYSAPRRHSTFII